MLGGLNGELWFAAHTRAAPDEMRSALARLLQAELHSTGHPVPALNTLLSRTPS